MKLYHVDRCKSLKEGQVLELSKFKGFNDVILNGSNMSLEFNKVINDLFDNELSSHGFRYVDAFNTDSYLPKLELLYELIRKIKYNDCPSRYKSFYAVEMKDIKKLMDKLNVTIETCNLYEVESDTYFKADMSLLKGDGRLSDIIYADKYWNQEESENPLTEYLLEYPVKILKKIDKLYL